ncbi:Crp/Fnr family transcriptional regulator [Cereibacter azotoformans]|uniref:Crp/Fnr family transcriptional regulator n=1 Tax=Cereibacter sphaeroides (strain ATCC 17025 / ATH 2.4.3) TaxID=349102 RepID=A4WYL6_CERS5|nr:Crp/Fnr family transcriptional regulator [Cereibacter azotoformans]ULB11932.1 Crp/Fnr family transcriptional regulator [Cereibacter azotoformans]
MHSSSDSTNDRQGSISARMSAGPPCAASGRRFLSRPALHGRKVRLSPDEVLVAEGNDIRSVWLLESGILRVQRIGLEGRRQILNLLLPGDLLGADLQGRQGLSVEACTKARLLEVPMADLVQTVRHSPELRRAVHEANLVHLERMRWLTWMLGALKPEERICAFLALAGRPLSPEQQPDGSRIVTNPLSRQDLSDLLGMTVESISRIIHRLDDQGVIEILSPTRFRIRNLARLLGKGGVTQDLSALALAAPDLGEWIGGAQPPMTAVNEARPAKAQVS